MQTQLAFLINSDAPAETSTARPWPFDLPSDGWYQLVIPGEFPCTDERTGKTVVQIIDADSLRLMKEAFDRAAAVPNFSGLLIDYDHFSENQDKATTAAGWITELQVRDDGLWFRARWASEGESNLKAGVYRHISPVFHGEYLDDHRVRPAVITAAALTNVPNIKGMVPLSNRSNPAKPAKKETHSMNEKMLELLGLSADATEAEIEAALAKLRADADLATQATADLAEMENRAKTAEAARLDVEAEAFCDEHQAKIKNRAAIKEQYLRDPKGTQAIVAGLSEPEPEHSTLHNRRSKKPADAVEVSKTDQFEAKVQEYRAANRCTYDRAFSAIRRAHPELLATETETDD
jgi:phage I-like protein